MANLPAIRTLIQGRLFFECNIIKHSYYYCTFLIHVEGTMLVHPKSHLPRNSRRRSRNRRYPVHRWSAASFAWCLGSRYTSWRATWRDDRTCPCREHPRSWRPGPCYDPGWRTRFRPWCGASTSSCTNRCSRYQGGWQPSGHPVIQRNTIFRLFLQLLEKRRLPYFLYTTLVYRSQKINGKKNCIVLLFSFIQVEFHTGWIS